MGPAMPVPPPAAPPVVLGYKRHPQSLKDFEVKQHANLPLYLDLYIDLMKQGGFDLADCIRELPTRLRNNRYWADVLRNQHGWEAANDFVEFKSNSSSLSVLQANATLLPVDCQTDS